MIPGTWIGSIAWAAAAFYGPETKGTVLVPIWSSPEQFGLTRCWPGVPVIPTMSGGYTDSRWLRNAGIPSHGASGLFTDPVNSGVHGRNEQVGAKELYDSKEFLYRLVKQLAGPNRATAQ